MRERERKCYTGPSTRGTPRKRGRHRRNQGTTRAEAQADPGPPQAGTGTSEAGPAGTSPRGAGGNKPTRGRGSPEAETTHKGQPTRGRRQQPTRGREGGRTPRRVQQRAQAGATRPPTTAALQTSTKTTTQQHQHSRERRPAPPRARERSSRTKQPLLGAPQAAREKTSQPPPQHQATKGRSTEAPCPA